MKTILFSTSTNVCTWIPDLMAIRDYLGITNCEPIISLSNKYDEPVSEMISKWRVLLTHPSYCNYVTWYEHPLLIAQQLHRQKEVRFQFVQVLFDSNQKLNFWPIPLGEDGDMLEDVRGGYFNERLSLLLR